MRRYFRNIVVTIIILISSVEAFATHIVGGDINVKWISGNIFEVRVYFFRDCNPGTANFNQTAVIGIYDKVNDAPRPPLTLSLIKRDTLVLGDICYSPNLCIERGTYVATVTIPDNPNGYYLSYHQCCRNSIINNIVGPLNSGYVFYAEIPNPALHNSTPVFNYDPDGYMCQGSPNTDDFSATDADGDSLAYSFSKPLDCAAAGQCSSNNTNPGAAPGPYGTITWSAGYSNTLPMGDPTQAVSNTGIISTLPPTLGVFVLCVRIEEYRNGVKIGEIRRDFQYQVLACNILTVTTSGKNPICLGESTTLNAIGGLTGATYVWFPSGQTTSSIMVKPTAAGSYSFSVLAMKGLCNKTADIVLKVNPAPTVQVTSVGDVCLGEDFTLTATGGGTYTWSNGATTDRLSGVPNGRYTVTVKNGFGCTDTASGLIIKRPILNSALTLSYIQCVDSVARIYVTASGGTTNYSYLWNTTNTTSVITGLGTGSYSVKVTDANGCTSIATQSVTVSKVAIAGFNATTECLNSSIQFSDQSRGDIISWQWDFGDVSESTLQNPSHKYAIAGTYTVMLKVINRGGCNATIKKAITVLPVPTALFNSTTVCVGNSTQFIDQSTDVMYWSWSFGDAVTSTDPNPSHIYANSGVFTAMLTVTNVYGCKATYLKPVTIHPNPVAKFSATLVCEGNATKFTDQSTGTTLWSWDFGDGQKSDQQSPTHTYLAPGTYMVKLLVTGVGSCTSVITNQVTINPNPISSYTANTVCFNNPSAFSDLSTGSCTQWKWNFGDGISSELQNPTHNYSTAGNFSVTLTVKNTYGCYNSSSKVVVVHDLPQASFKASTVCVGTSTDFIDLSSVLKGIVTGWSWNFDDPNSGLNNTSNIQYPNHTFTRDGVFSVLLTVTSDKGCQGITYKEVNVSKVPVAGFSYPHICANSNVSFLDSSLFASKWQWNFGDGGISTDKNPKHIFSNSGSYPVRLIVYSAGGCSDTIRRTVNVNPIPVVNFLADSVCKGNPTSFSDLSITPSGTIASWTWNFGDGKSSSDKNPVHTYSKDGAFSVILTVKSDNNCTVSRTKNIVVHGLPTSEFSTSPQPIARLTDIISFKDISSGNPVKWWWKFGDGDSARVQYPSHMYNDTGSYVIRLVVSNKYGCLDTIEHPIRIKDFSFYIPNAFTPNGDGHNDLFFGKGIGIKEYEMAIFDRWGNMVFLCNVNDLPQTPPCMWDGSVQGGGSHAISVEDVFTWKVHLTDIFGNPHDYIGSVALVR